VVQALATAHLAFSIACWDTRLWEDHRKELVWKLASGVELNFNAKQSPALQLPLNRKDWKQPHFFVPMQVLSFITERIANSHARADINTMGLG